MPTRPGRELRHDPVGPCRRCRVQRRTHSRTSRSDVGMATAELVVVLPAIVLALLLGVGAVGAATARMRCADAAAVAARLAARGEDRAAVVEAARRVAPANAVVQVSGTPSTVHVTVTVAAQLLPLAGLVPPIAVAAEFTQDREPGPPP